MTATPTKELIAYEVVQYLTVPIVATFEAPPMDNAEVVAYAEANCDFLSNDDDAYETGYWTVNGNDYYEN